MAFNKKLIYFSANVAFSGMLFSYTSSTASSAVNFTNEEVFFYLKDRAKKSKLYEHLDPEHLFSLREEDLEGKSLTDLVDMYVFLEERILNSREQKSDASLYSPFLPSYLSEKENRENPRFSDFTLSLPKTKITPSVFSNNDSYVHSHKIFEDYFAENKERIRNTKIYPDNMNVTSTKNVTNTDSTGLCSRIFEACGKYLTSVLCSKGNNESFEEVKNVLPSEGRTKISKKLICKINKIYKEFPVDVSRSLISKKLNSNGSDLFRDYICENGFYDILDISEFEKLKPSNFKSPDEFFESLFNVASRLSKNIEIYSKYFRAHCVSSKSDATATVLKKFEILNRMTDVLFKVYFVLTKNSESRIFFPYENFSFLIDNSMHVLNLRESSKNFLEDFAKCLLDALFIYGNAFVEYSNEAENNVRKNLVGSILESMQPLKEQSNILEDMKEILLKWTDERENTKSIFSEKVSTIEYELQEMERFGEFKATFINSK